MKEQQVLINAPKTMCELRCDLKSFVPSPLVLSPDLRPIDSKTRACSRLFGDDGNPRQNVVKILVEVLRC